MTTVTRASLMIGLIVVLSAAVSRADDLPVVKGKAVVANVQGEIVTRDELLAQVKSARQELAADKSSDRGHELAVLDRLINVILIVQEARRIGLDQLPEVKKTVEAESRVMLREELVGKAIAEVTADPADVEKIYRQMVRQWRVSAVLLPGAEQANALAAEVAAGKPFADAAAAYVADGRATKRENDVLLKRDTVEPEIGKVIAALAEGGTTPAVRTREGYVVLRLDGVEYPDDPAARAEAERTVLGAKRKEAVAKLDEALKKKYVKIDEALLKSLDYESEKPGMEALLKDQRPLARIKGEKPVTVAELSEALKFQFFHGTAMAAERRKLNTKKEQVLDGLLHRKVFRKEALRLRLERTDSYRNKVRDYERSLLFNAFVRKAIAGDVKIVEDDLKRYYQEHRADFTTPEMVRLRGLAFSERADAERAVGLLKTGADFQWVAGRTEGQLDPATKNLLSFDGRPIMTTELPEPVRKAVDGARVGDARLFAASEGHFYALQVQDVIPAQPRPYEDVRNEIGHKVVALKVEQAVEAYAAKLRTLSEVTVYLKKL